MAQFLYDTSPLHSLQVDLSASDPMHPTSVQLSQYQHNMRNAGSTPKKRVSRLELLRNDFSRKLQMEREAKLNELRVIEQQNNKSRGSNSGGMVREFFAERRALEAARKGQKNPELLPPIESHFKKMKQQKQGTPPQTLIQVSSLPKKHANLQHGIQPQQKSLPAKYTAPVKTKKIGYNVRKRTKGIDKQDPLPPVNKDNPNTASRKPPTPNKRYETHSVLLQDNDGQEAMQHGKYAPAPPIMNKPQLRRPKVPLPPPSSEAVSDHEDAMSTLTDNSSIAPNLSSLKAKALRQRQLSKQKLLASDHVMGENTKLTEFQKWQLDQDLQRKERLERQFSDNVDESLAQKEKDLLKKIEEEQNRLQQLQQQRQKLEEKETRQEEDRNWITQKQTSNESSTLPWKDSTQNSHTETKRKTTVKLVHKKPRPETQPHQQKAPTDVVFEESENIHDHSYLNFYAEQTKDIGEEAVNLSPCSVCGRNFATDRLAKHEKVCTKNVESKRKVFDSRRQRSLGTENQKYVESTKFMEEPKKKPKVDWRAQHENFIKTIRYAKGVSNEPPPPMENPDYVQCPHCKRKFNPSTAERHIPRCKEIKARPAPPKKKR